MFDVRFALFDLATPGSPVDDPPVVAMKTKLVLTIAIVIGVLALIAAGYCFWLMDNPLSYRWVPVVLTGFVLAIFMFVISLIASLVAVIRLRRSIRAPNVPQIRRTI